MAFNQGARYKYGSHARPAPSTSLTLIAEVIPKYRTLQIHTSAPIRLSKMSGTHESNNPQVHPDQERQFVEWGQEQQRAVSNAHVYSGIPRNADHAAWLQKQRDRETRVEEPVPSIPRSGSIAYKSAEIHDPTQNTTNTVQVIEDTACRINFISPRVARLCNLTLFPTPPIENHTLMGTFTSNQWTEVTWIGSRNTGHDMFYVAPDVAPIDVLVGTQFMSDHPNAFEHQAQLEPAFLSVQSIVKPAERSQIQADEAHANRLAAELAMDNKRKRDAKEHKSRDTGKQGASASSLRSSRRKKE